MKQLRIALVAVIVVTVLAAAFFWSRPSKEQGFTAPRDCVEAFYNAAPDKDDERLARCLVPALRSNARQLAAEKKTLMSFVVSDTDIAGDTARVDVDEIRRGSDEARRIRFHLEKQKSGWVIGRIGSAETVKLNVPAGTPVTSVPEP